MAQANQPAINLRSLLAKLKNLKPAPVRETFTFEFDGTETSQVLPLGWKPFAVYLDGLRQFEGVNNHYTAASDGFQYTVTWAVAPSGTSACHIDAERTS